MLRIIGAIAVRIAGKLIPDPYIFAIILSTIIFIMGVTLTDTSPMTMVMHWYDGFWNLLQFGMQMILLLLFGSVLAGSPPVRRLIAKLAGKPKTAGQAILLVVFLTMIFAYINWGLGVIVGAICAREVCIQCKQRGIKVHFPLAAAAGFSSMMFFGGGLSATAPLLVNSDNHFLYQQIGRIPIAETLLSPTNLIMMAVWFLVMPFVYRAMHPKSEDITEIEIDHSEEQSQSSPVSYRSGQDNTVVLEGLYQKSPLPRERETAAYDSGDIESAAVGVLQNPMQIPTRGRSLRPQLTLAQWLENSACLTWFVVAAGLTYIAYHFLINGFDLNLNIANFVMMIAGMIAYRTPIAYVKAVNDSIGSCGQLALQFPFYAGIMGMMVGSGLVNVFAGWLIHSSTPFTLPLFSFLASGLVNIFIPSAGGQWAVQGPLLMEAAKVLGVDYSTIILAFTHGDQWTNGMQPLWMLPLLGVTALKVNQIVGYTVVVMCVSFLIWAMGLTFLPLLFN